MDVIVPGQDRVRTGVRPVARPCMGYQGRSFRIIAERVLRDCAYRHTFGRTTF